jgi:hypothetical protein
MTFDRTLIDPTSAELKAAFVEAATVANGRHRRKRAAWRAEFTFLRNAQ